MACAEIEEGLGESALRDIPAAAAAEIPLLDVLAGGEPSSFPMSCASPLRRNYEDEVGQFPCQLWKLSMPCGRLLPLVFSAALGIWAVWLRQTWGGGAAELSVGDLVSKRMDIVANSGCFVEVDRKMLAIKHTSMYAWTLDVPGGTREGVEPAAQTAIRETYEETGYRVMPTNVKSIRSNGFVIFNCVLEEPQQTHIPDMREVAKVLWLPTDQLREDWGWRFPDEVALFRRN